MATTPTTTSTILFLVLIWATAPILTPVTALDTDTLSIGTTLSRSAYHDCVTHCLVRVPLADNDNLQTALGCATPVVNGCYCATSAAAVSAASSFLPSCASLSCSRGDVAGDLSVMRDAYARYCLDAGFTATGWSGWVVASTTSAPATTRDDGGGGGRTTGVGVSVVTTTVVDGTRSVTLTLTVDSNGSPVPAAPASEDGQTGAVLAVGLGVGLGLGIPLLLSLIAIALLLWFRHKRQPSPQEVAPVVLDGRQEVKTVKSAVASDAGPIPREELDGRAIFQAPP